MPPRRRRPKRKPRRRRAKKSSYSRNFTKTRGSGLLTAAPLGKSFKFKTQYALNFDLNSSGLPISYVFSMNSLYFPNITGIVGQPIGFDQLMPLYDHYTVIGSRARVIMTNQDTTSPAICLVSLKDVATTSTDVSEIIENGLARYAVLTARDGPHSQHEFTMNCSPKKFFRKNALNNTSLQGSIISSPTEQVYLHVTQAPLDGADTTVMKCTIEIEYIAILTEPKLLAPS